MGKPENNPKSINLAQLYRQINLQINYICKATELGLFSAWSL